MHRAQAEEELFGTAEACCRVCGDHLPATFFQVDSAGRRRFRCHTCRSDDDAQRRMQLVHQARTAFNASVQ